MNSWQARWDAWAAVAGGVLLFAWTTMLLIFVPPAWVSWTTGLLGLALVGAAAFVNRAALLKTALLPQLRYGSNALLFTAAVVAIAALLNVIATRHSARTDLTANRFFSLSDQTRKVCKSLSRKVKLTAFFKDGSKEQSQLRDLLKEYEHLTSQLEVEFVDPDRKPAKAQIYKISAMNTTVLESGTKRKDILPHELFGYNFGGQFPGQQQPQQEFKGEAVVTAGLLSVSQDTQQTIYFLGGHGERSIQDSGENGVSGLKAQLERDNYVVKEVNLLKEGKIPADADLLVEAGPKRVVPDPERTLIEKWLAKDGKLLVLLDLDTSAGLDPLLRNYGVTPLSGMVVDPRSFYYFGGPLVPIPTYRSHKITADLQKQGVGSVFPGARALATGHVDHGMIDSLMESTSESWLAKKENLKEGPPTRAAGDKRGPLTIGVAVSMEPPPPPPPDPKAPAMPPEPAGPKPKLVVFAAVDFLANKIRSVSDGNFDLFGNAVNWLAGSELTISIRPKEQEQRRLSLDNVRANLMGYTAIVFTPLLVIGLGVFRWWRRRSL